MQRGYGVLWYTFSWLSSLVQVREGVCTYGFDSLCPDGWKYCQFFGLHPMLKPVELFYSNSQEEDYHGCGVRYSTPPKCRHVGNRWQSHRTTS
ncbi:hypothetical protein B0H16DRAFT_1577298 [Mycena metata]|uniref:Uncharacterized protein n=1 Tax=Mycena metata TaxID=1033252 RepID=A0AAD7I5V1_9AGAR|nr:hypothetical protein B0H16DRAFT_1577298 [Mycena metata]